MTKRVVAQLSFFEDGELMLTVGDEVVGRVVQLHCSDSCWKEDEAAQND